MTYSSITFDDNEIGTDASEGRYTERIQHQSMPKRELNTLSLADDGLALTDANFKEKEIKFITKIIKDTATDLKDTIDTFKYNLSGEEKELVITDRNESIARRYTATLSGMDITINDKIATIEYSFAVLLGTGEEIGITEPVDESLSFAYHPGYQEYYGNLDFTLGGSYPPKPTMTLTLNEDFSSIKGISIFNITTDEEMIIEGDYDWLRGDEIIIDFKTKKVYYNSEEVIYKGTMPDFVIGTNYFLIRAGNILIESFAETFGSDSTFDLDDADKIIAQGFSLDQSIDTISSIALPLKKTGSPGNITLNIYEGDNEPETALLDDITISESDVETFYNYIIKSFTPEELLANQNYWITLTAAGVDNDNKYHWALVDFDSYPKLRYRKGYPVISTDGSTYADYFDYGLMFRLYAGGSPEEKTIDVKIEYRKTYL